MILDALERPPARPHPVPPVLMFAVFGYRQAVPVLEVINYVTGRNGPPMAWVLLNDHGVPCLFPCYVAELVVIPSHQSTDQEA